MYVCMVDSLCSIPETQHGKSTIFKKKKFYHTTSSFAFLIHLKRDEGVPGGSVVKNPPANAGDMACAATKTQPSQN